MISNSLKWQPKPLSRQFLATVNHFFKLLGMLSALFARILSFWELNFALIVKIFLSEKIISHALVPFFIQFKRILDLSNLFCFCNAVSCCLFDILKGDILRSSLTMVLTVFSLIFISLAICLILLLEFLLICCLIALIFNEV